MALCQTWLDFISVKSTICKVINNKPLTDTTAYDFDSYRVLNTFRFALQ